MVYYVSIRMLREMYEQMYEDGKETIQPSLLSTLCNLLPPTRTPAGSHSTSNTLNIIAID